MMVSPWIDASVKALRPDFRAISMVASNVENCPAHPAARERLAEAASDLDCAPWAEAHLEAWREAFRAFGAKPKKTPGSAEALRSRLAKGAELPSVNAVVDLYNAVSIQYALPIGGEDLDSYAGQPRLVRAAGGEPFDTLRDGAEVTEAVEAGEVIWRDDLGATCRRWNWRQCLRTRVRPESTRLWFVLEALQPMPDEALESAAAALHDGLMAISQSARIQLQWLR